MFCANSGSIHGATTSRHRERERPAKAIGRRDSRRQLGKSARAGCTAASATGESLRPDAQATAASTTMVSPPRIGLANTLTSTCAPPSTTQATARLASDVPETIASMKALTSQGTPMFGSTLDSGVISAPARQASPAPNAKVDEPHPRC